MVKEYELNLRNYLNEPLTTIRGSKEAILTELQRLADQNDLNRLEYRAWYNIVQDMEFC